MVVRRELSERRINVEHSLSEGEGSVKDPCPVHVCKNCGRIVHRSEMKSAEIVSGVIECPACAHPGPLNVEIMNTDQKKPPSSASDS